MERIREAVERARQERGARGLLFAPGSAGQLPAPTEHDGQIAYTKTRTVEVPRSAMRDRRIVADGEASSSAESFRILSTRVSQALREHRWSTVAVTSPCEGEGKTLVAINLAIGLASEFQQTSLLVEADLRRPSVRELFGLEPGAGLADYLMSGTPIEQLLINPGIPRFVMLPAGAPQPHSAEMLGWRKMTALVEELRSRYPSRIVVFDLPPLLATADVLAFAPHVEAALLVVEEGRTRRDDVRRAADLLGSTHLIGTVLNKSDERTVRYGER
jgi:capsular exopolysaccharide synthesis family protein